MPSKQPLTNTSPSSNPHKKRFCTKRKPLVKGKLIFKWSFFNVIMLLCHNSNVRTDGQTLGYAGNMVNPPLLSLSLSLSVHCELVIRWAVGWKCARGEYSCKCTCLALKLTAVIHISKQRRKKPKQSEKSKVKSLKVSPWKAITFLRFEQISNLLSLGEFYTKRDKWWKWVLMDFQCIDVIKIIMTTELLLELHYKNIRLAYWNKKETSKFNWSNSRTHKQI